MQFDTLRHVGMVSDHRIGTGGDQLAIAYPPLRQRQCGVLQPGMDENHHRVGAASGVGNAAFQRRATHPGIAGAVFRTVVEYAELRLRHCEQCQPPTLVLQP